MSLEINHAALFDCWFHIFGYGDSHTDSAGLAGVVSGRSGVRLARTRSRITTFHCAVIIREICSQPVGQGPCELVVCVVSEKYFPIAAFRAFESGDCHRSHACVFVWAYLNIDFAKRLNFPERGRINVEESARGDLSYVRGPRNAACQQGFGCLLQSQKVLAHDRMNCMRHFGISHYFAELDEMHMSLTLEQREGAAPAVY
jgi:hypothetical protein